VSGVCGQALKQIFQKVHIQRVGGIASDKNEGNIFNKNLSGDLPRSWSGAARMIGIRKTFQQRRWIAAK